MPLPRCPHCQVALTEDEVGSFACPVCTTALREPPPAPPKKPRRWLIPAAVAVLACIVVTWLVWPRQQEDVEEKPGAVAQDAPKKPEQPTPKTVAQAPADPEPITAEPRAEQEAVVRAETLPAPAIEDELPAVKPMPKPVKEVVGHTVVYNQPDDNVSIGRVTDDTKMRLSGRVKSLTIAEVNNAATVDASKLQAKRIVVRGVGGGTRVVVKADEVVFEGPISGDAEVIVEAAKVTFSATGGIDGSCRLDVKARDVDFRGPLVGGVRVLVTLASGGSLRFAKTDGGAVLQWRKASADDPTPKLHKGEVKGGSRFVEAKKLEKQ